MKARIIEILNKYKWLILFVIISYLVRIANIGTQSLYGDEAYSIYYAQHSLSELFPIFSWDQNPPLHTILLHFWITVFGVTDVSVKGFSAICSILAGLFLFLLLQKRTNTKVAVIASFLYLISNAQQFYATESRMYALVELLAVLSLIGYFRLMIDKPKWIWVLFLAIMNYALLFTHYLSVHVLIVEFLCCFIFFKKNKKGVYYYWISTLLTGLLFLPWLKIMLRNIPVNGSFWNKIPGYGELRWHLGFLMGTDGLFYLFTTLFFLSLFVFIFRKQVLDEKPGIDKRIYAFFALLLVVPVFLNFAIAQFTPVFLSRYILYCTIGLFVCLAIFISEITLNNVFKVPAMVALAIVVWVSFDQNPHKEDDWRRLVKELKTKEIDDAYIFVSASYKIKEFSFYYDHDAFCDYRNTDSLLFRKHIYYFDHTQSECWGEMDLSKVNKIVYVQSHSQFEDPEEKIKQVILDNHFEQEFFSEKGGAHYTIYKRVATAITPKP